MSVITDVLDSDIPDTEDEITKRLELEASLHGIATPRVRRRAGWYFVLLETDFYDEAYLGSSVPFAAAMIESLARDFDYTQPAPSGSGDEPTDGTN